MPSVTRKPQANRRQRQEQLERRLLDATERLMGGGASFTALSVDRLSTEAGISRASFYIYFEDKGHLLRRLAAAVFAELASGGELWWSVAGRHDPDDARAAIAGIIASFRRHQPVLVALNEMAGYDPATAQTYRDLLIAISGRVTQVIEDGQADGSIRPELPAAATGSALTWMVERACQQELPANRPDYDTELAASLTEIIWGALYLKPVR
jgi:TetR/AcrR family transcriptional regulator, ethionamide resistance regulator